MPCMNRTSAAVCWTRDRSTAVSTVMTRLDCPGAPGWTIGGRGSAPVAPHEAARKASGTAAERFISLRTGQRIHIRGPARHTVPVNVLLIALGGALGSVCRYGLSTVVQPFTSSFFPYGTFVVNVGGCLAFCLVIGAARARFVLGPSARAFLLIGILGGFTTVSTFTYETFALLQDGQL